MSGFCMGYKMSDPRPSCARFDPVLIQPRPMLESPLRRLSIMTCGIRSEEHTSELQSRLHLVCRLLLEKKKNHHPPLSRPVQTHLHARSEAPTRACAQH